MKNNDLLLCQNFKEQSELSLDAVNALSGKFYIGLMSGTSMDGIDAALVDVTRHRLIGAVTHPYSSKAREFLRSVLSSRQVELKVLNQLNTILGHEFADAVSQLLQQSLVSQEKIVAIGSHGQTICHDAMASTPYTVQLACPHVIAERTGMTVVSDFRTRDLVVGGQGAPFAPLYHQALFGNRKEAVIVVNIGGIANITYLHANGAVSGYDVGPGNCLMDSWVDQHLNLPYDHHGKWAATGQINLSLLNELCQDPFFEQSSPKSIGKEYFNLNWLRSNQTRETLIKQMAPVDVQATLLALTVYGITQSVKKSINPIEPRKIFICGGGVHNTALLDALSRALPEMMIDSIEHMNIHPDFVEAMMFAWLADKTLNRIPVDLSMITGAQKPVILGTVVYGTHSANLE